MADISKEVKNTIKSIDLIATNSSGSKRVFLTATIDGKDYEHFVDCPLVMTETPEEYVAANLSKITASIVPGDSKDADEGMRDYKHPVKIAQLKQIVEAVTIESKVNLIIEMLKNQM